MARIIDKDVSKLMDDLQSRGVVISELLLAHLIKISERLKATEKECD